MTLSKSPLKGTRRLVSIHPAPIPRSVLDDRICPLRSGIGTQTACSHSRLPHLAHMQASGRDPSHRSASASSSPSSRTTGRSDTREPCLPLGTFRRGLWAQVLRGMLRAYRSSTAKSGTFPRPSDTRKSWSLVRCRCTAVDPSLSCRAYRASSGHSGKVWTARKARSSRRSNSQKVAEEGYHQFLNKPEIKPWGTYESNHRYRERTHCMH